MINIELLTQFNAHWRTNRLEFEVPKSKRQLFSVLSQQLDSRFTLTIHGLRRTGKSVLQQQLVEEYVRMHSGIELKHVFLFSFDDDDELDLLPTEDLDAVLRLYFRDVLRIHPQQLKTKTLIALDEVQCVKNWQKIIKRYYDLSPHIKFIITGSSSLYLQEGADSLAGRVVDYFLPCLSFQEFLNLSGQTLELPFIENLEGIHHTVPFQVNKDDLEAFENFLLLGAFPDTAKMFGNGESVEFIQDFIRRSIVNKVISKDLRKYYRIKNTAADRRLFEICCNESGSFVEIKNLAPEAGLSAVSVKAHLDIFERCGLISMVARFDKKLRRAIKSTRKLYVGSPCLMFAVLFKTNTLDTAFLGHAAETYALQRLRHHSEQIYVERGRKAEDEVDFYLPVNEMLLECKYAERIKLKDLSYLTSQLKRQELSGAILTKHSWSIGETTGMPLLLL